MVAPTPTPFKIAIPQDALDTLQKRLEGTTLPPPVPAHDDPWHYGVPDADIARLLEYWKTTYNWRAAEAALNADMPQYTLPITVQGHGVFRAHFVHQKAKRETKHKTIPLLFCHGWPGHFGEVRKILPLLTNPESDEDPAFDVVAPSWPGYGFSDAPEKSGFAMAQYAEFAHNVMLALGYDEYVVQGGDLGFAIAHAIVHKYGPKHAKAWHTNFAPARPPSFSLHPRLYLANLLTPYTEEEKKGLERTAWYAGPAHAYFDLQSTTPQTLAYLLADSPVGLLAWLYERLVLWSDEYPWTEDEILTWIHIYLLSGTQGTSSASTTVRLYFEIDQAKDIRMAGDPKYYNGDVPMGISLFPKELILTPHVWHHTLGHVVYTKRHPHGGHFAAHEHPAELVADVRKVFTLPEVRKEFSSL